MKYKAPKQSHVAKVVGVNTSELYKMQDGLSRTAKKDREKNRVM